MKRVLIDLDSLLDTRLGVLAVNDPESAEVVVGKEAYWEREHDDWAGLTNGRVDNTTFVQWWKARDAAVLRASMMSGMLMVLGQLLSEYNRNQQEGIVHEDIALEINLHPYTLTTEEIEELSHVLQETLYDDLVVSVSSYTREDLTPAVMNKRYAAVIMYDFAAWIKQHCFNIGKQRCPGLNVIVPRLFEKDPSDLTVGQKQEEILGFRLWLMEYIDFDFIDVRWFSLINAPPEEDA